MQICRLLDAPQHVDTFARWVWEEWAEVSNVSLDVTRERLVDHRDCPPTLIATESDEPLGVLSFRRFQRALSEPASLFIDALFVRAELRGRGIGTALLQQAITEAKTFAPSVFVFTDQRDWYEKRGWSSTVAKTVGDPVVLVRQT